MESLGGVWADERWLRGPVDSSTGRRVRLYEEWADEVDGTVR